MLSAKVSSKGRITIPALVRESLGLETGDLVEFVKVQNGIFAVVAASISVQRLKGIIRRPLRPVSIADMNAAIATKVSRLSS
jgi:antitoxin PrlF